MLPSPPLPQPTPPSRGGTLFFIWLAWLAVIIFDQTAGHFLQRVAGFPRSLFAITTFFAALVCIALTLYAFAVAVRWTLRKLFWRVGRRLFLSYVLVGVLPFFLFAILLLTIAYMIAGVMSHAALRGERQASLGQMESAALEYGLTAKKPVALPTLEIYDTATPSGAQLPAWLKETTFSGMAWREKEPLLV